MLLYVEEGERVGSLPQRTRWPGPPSGSLRPDLGWDPVAERWRLKRGSGGPTGTQLLCRSIGSFTACRITHNSVLTGALQEHLLPTLPCPGHFTARQAAENNTRKMLVTYRVTPDKNMGPAFPHYWALSLSRGKASTIEWADSQQNIDILNVFWLVTTQTRLWF